MPVSTGKAESSSFPPLSPVHPDNSQLHTIPRHTPPPPPLPSTSHPLAHPSCPHARMPATTVTLNPLGGPTHDRPASEARTNGCGPQLPEGSLIGQSDLTVSGRVPPPLAPLGIRSSPSISESSCEEPRRRRRVGAVAPSVRSAAGGEGAPRRGGGVAVRRASETRPPVRSAARPPRAGAPRVLPGRTQSRRPRQGRTRLPGPAGDTGAAPSALREAHELPGPAAEPPEPPGPRQRRAGERTM